MTRANKFLTNAGSFVAALSALAVITAPVGVQPDDEKLAGRYENPSCNSCDGNRSRR